MVIVCVEHDKMTKDSENTIEVNVIVEIDDEDALALAMERKQIEEDDLLFMLGMGNFVIDPEIF